jgi:transposase-like protein
MPQPLSSRSSPSPRQPLIGANTERCIYCEGTRITREGKRYKQLETVQLWFCHDCDRVFTPQVVQGKRTPRKVILESLCLSYRGETRKRVAQRVKVMCQHISGHSVPLAFKACS